MKRSFPNAHRAKSRARKFFPPLDSPTFLQKFFFSFVCFGFVATIQCIYMYVLYLYPIYFCRFAFQLRHRSSLLSTPFIHNNILFSTLYTRKSISFCICDMWYIDKTVRYFSFFLVSLIPVLFNPYTFLACFMQTNV